MNTLAGAIQIHCFLKSSPKIFPFVAFGGTGMYAEFCKGGANMGYFKKRGGEAASSVRGSTGT